MGHERLRAHLAEQRRILSSAGWVERLGDGLLDHFTAQTMPASFMDLAGQLSKVKEREGRFEIRLGPYEDMGAPRAQAGMRGTIERFLKDYPRFRRRSRQLYEEKVEGRTAERAPWLKGTVLTRRIVRRNRHDAWWNLPKEGKELLQARREQGAYGGQNAAAANLIPYFFGHDQSLRAWERSGLAAGLNHPGHWVRTARQKFRNQTRPFVMATLRRALRQA